MIPPDAPALVPAGPLHAAVCSALHATAFPEPWDAASLAALLADPGAVALIARDADSPRGFILCRLAADEAEVLTIAVDPAARRRGLGTLLLTAATRRLATGGATRLFLEVAEDNAPARALYAGAGFIQVGRRKDYYHSSSGGRTDALVLVLDGLAP